MVSVQGNVEVSRAGQTQWQPARLNDTYCAGDRIQVGERSRADIALVNQPVLRLDQNTTITFGGVKRRTNLSDRTAPGSALFLQPSAAEPRSAYHLCQCRCGRDRRVGQSRGGQDLDHRFSKARSWLPTRPGVSHSPAASRRSPSQGRAPVLTVVVRPRDAVQWALYYPPDLYFRPEEFPAGPGLAGDGSKLDRGLHEGRSSGGLRKHQGSSGYHQRATLLCLSRLVAAGRGARRRGEQGYRARAEFKPELQRCLGAAVDYRGGAKRQRESTRYRTERRSRPIQNPPRH